MAGAHVSLVTGGGAGIGAAVARHLAVLGSPVVVAGRTLARCEEVAAGIEATGGSAVAVQLDVTDPASIAAGVSEAIERTAEHGAISWLVNNAGVARAGSAFRGADATGADPFEELLAVNFHGARRMVDALLPDMRAAGHGRIVNLASSAGLRGYKRIAPYCASKHALIGYTRAAALELEGTGVCMGAVCPHFVDSPTVEAAVAEVVESTGKDAAAVRAWYVGQNPGGRLVTMQEVADAVAALLSSDANGAIVELDGGPPRELERIG